MVGLALDSAGIGQSKDRLRRVFMTVLAAYWVLCLLRLGLNAWVVAPYLSPVLSEQMITIFRAMTALNFAAYATLAFVTVRAISRPVRWEWQILAVVLVCLLISKAPYTFATVLSGVDGNGWMSVFFAVLTPVIVLTQIFFLRWSRA